MSIVKYDESTALSADSHTNTESTGPMIAAAAMEEEVSLQVADYYFVDSGALFDQHYFMIQVTIEHFKYMVDRTYVDFVRLDQSLRKKFPETKICPLPLDSKKEIAKLILKDSPQHTAASKGVDGSSPLNSSRTSFLYSRESMQRSTSVMSHGTSPLRIHSTFAIPASHTEVISAKGKLLEAYLRELLTKHEVVSSDELLRFLDEELRRVDAFELEESLSVHDLLLLSTTPIRCIVTKSEEHGFHVPPGHMVVWRFETRHFDIGFCVEMDGDAKVPYTRCSSHKAPVCGALEATDKSSVCLLKWDNSYAKCKACTCIPVSTSHSHPVTLYCTILHCTVYDSPIEDLVMGCARRICGGVPPGEDPGVGVPAGEEALRAATVRPAAVRHPAGSPHLRGSAGARLLHRARVCQGGEVR